MADPILHFCMIQFRLKEARADVLNGFQISEAGLKQLEDEAFASMSGDVVNNEYGRVQKIYDKPIQYSAHRLSKSNQIIPAQAFKYRLKFTSINQLQERE